MIEQAPILIVGCPRSGTSMIGGAIKMCGAFTGDLIKRGMFENKNILEGIVDPYFLDLGVDRNGQYPLPSINDLSIPVSWRQKVEQSIVKEGYHGMEGGKWMYKDSRSSLIWPVWNHAFPNAKWIIVRRRTGDIVQSCLKTGYMSAYTSEDVQKEIGVDSEQAGWIWWVHQYEKRFVEMIEAGLNCKVVWPERMVCGDYQQMHETLEWLGLAWNKDIINWIDPLLWYNRKKERIE